MRMASGMDGPTVEAAEAGRAPVGAGRRAPWAPMGASLLAICLLPAAASGEPAAAGKAAGADDAFMPAGSHLTLPPPAPGTAAAASAALVRALGTRTGLGAQLASGQKLFYRDWSSEPHDQRIVAGPHFDRGGCAGCHLEAARGAEQQTAPYLVARLLTAGDRERFGAQANTRSLGDHAPQARVRIAYEAYQFRYPDGTIRELRRPVPRATIQATGETLAVGLRIAPLLFGWGLLEHVDLDSLAPFHDPEDRDRDGISGQRGAAVDYCTGARRTGLFGWKANEPALQQQIAAALTNDMGVESLEAGCDDRARSPASAAELSHQDLRDMTEFVRYLGVPTHRRQQDTDEYQRGERLFGRVGCLSCHVAVLITRDDGPAALADQRLWPYSDLMLHDMGPALADPHDGPDAAEWRTAPLWGIGLVEERMPRRGFLHDGRARDIEEAVLWHGGEAAPARDAFAALDAGDRATVLKYIRSL